MALKKTKKTKTALCAECSPSHTHDVLLSMVYEPICVYLSFSPSHAQRKLCILV